MAELTAAELGEEVEGSEERIGALCGAKIRGFRSPRSRWSSSLLDILHRRGYLWNAEGDPSPYPYQVPRGYARPLVRIPVAVDDWDYVRHRASPGAVSRLWRHEVLRAMETGCWVAIGSHPSVLGAHPERMSAFGEFVRWLAAQKVAVLTHGEAAEWWLARIRGGGGGSRAATAGAAEQA